MSFFQIIQKYVFIYDKNSVYDNLNSVKYPENETNQQNIRYNNIIQHVYISSKTDDIFKDVFMIQVVSLSNLSCPNIFSRLDRLVDIYDLYKAYI